MKKIEPGKEQELLQYMDGELSSVRASALEKELTESADLAARLKELQTIRRFLLSKATLETPSKTFTQKVIEGLDTQPVRSVFSPRNGLLLLVGIMIAYGLVVSLLSFGVFDGTPAPLTITPPAVTKEWFTLPAFKIPFNGKMIVNAILIFNMGLAFVLLDRTILRPIFQKRSAAF